MKQENKPTLETIFDIHFLFPKSISIILPRIFVLLILVIYFSLNCAARSADAYTMPIGIPNPSVHFGSVDPIEDSAPLTASKCPDWPSSETTGCYYINKSAQCSNSNTFGYPNNPRCSIPESYTAGSYVEIHGGNYTEKLSIQSKGTQSNPVWIRGVPGDKPIMRMEFSISGSYTFIENLEWSGNNDIYVIIIC